MKKIATSYPGIYVKEISTKPHVIKNQPTSITAFVGLTEKGPLNKATKINSFSEFENIFGTLQKFHNLGYVVYHYFLNGGINAVIVSVGHQKTTLNNTILGDETLQSGIYALNQIENFNILCILLMMKLILLLFQFINKH